MVKLPSARNLIALLSNPVLYKELSIGLRDRKVFVIQTIYLTILSIALFIVLIAYLESSVTPADLGKAIFITLFIIQMILVVLIAPALTCGSVSSEKERKTFELLIGTLLTPYEIISGKLIYGLSHIFLLLVSSLPIAATVFFLGGVSPAQLIVSYLAIFATGFICCQIGEFFSVREAKTSNATNQSYLLIILFAIIFLPVLIAFIDYYHYSSPSWSSFTYKSVHFPIWLFVFLNFTAVAGFLFTKTANYISHQARNIIWLNGFFILSYILNLSILSALVSNDVPSSEEIGRVLTLITIINLFFIGFFGSPSTFPTSKELGIFKKSIISRPYFFPLLFTISILIPGSFFALELPGSLSPLLSSLYLNGFYILTFFVLSRAMGKIFKNRLPFAFFYYLILIVMSFFPYISFLKDTAHNPETLFTSFQFLSPPIVIYSLWPQYNYPSSVFFFDQSVPLPLFSLLAYLFILLLVGILYKVFAKRRVENNV